MAKRFWASLLCLTLAATANACGLGNGAEVSATPPLGIHAVIASVDRFALGPARFVFELRDPRGQRVSDATLNLRFYYIDPVRELRKTLKSFVAAAPIELDERYEITRGSGETITLGPGVSGTFATQIGFDQAGGWIVEIKGRAGNSNVDIEAEFTVEESSPEPRINQLAPPIDGRTVEGPSLVVFGDDETCHSEVCGPLTELAREVQASHSDTVGIEVITIRSGNDDPIPEWAELWGLGDEQVIYFIGEDGRIRGELRAAASRGEVNSHIQLLVQ